MRPTARGFGGEPECQRRPKRKALRNFFFPMPAGCQIAVLHGDPARPNADVFLKLPAKSSFTKHKHTSAERMILLSGELHVTYEGQTQTVVKAGSYMYGPAGRAHSGSCASAEPCLLFIGFEGPVDATVVN